MLNALCDELDKRVAAVRVLPRQGSAHPDIGQSDGHPQLETASHYRVGWSSGSV